ncbi:complement factor H-related protein 4-like [Scylla paramamosain]|uniref:complement factor H-related protein 4-like n=1 Tax=Scylla paramamosain TaxID=85552 RepID=UPI003082F026
MWCGVNACGVRAKRIRLPSRRRKTPPGTAPPDSWEPRIECPEEPPSAPANSTLEDAVPPYWVTSNVTYECEEGLGLPWGGTVTVLTCEEDGWTAFPTGLKCLAACSPPPQPRGLGKYNHTGPTLWGTVVEYTCPYGFDVEEKDEEDEGPMLLSTTCEDGSWSLTDIPNCYGTDCYVYT